MPPKKITKQVETESEFPAFAALDKANDPNVPVKKRRGRKPKGGKIITPKKNFALTFPSNWAFLHQGMKVIKGIKKIMVVHFYATMNRVLL